MTTPTIIVDQLDHRSLRRQATEIVDRKGVGHPDSICDALHEQISIELSRAYQERFGRVLHHNIDKGLLVAGVSAPQLGGGKMVRPMRLVVGDRATNSCDGRVFDVHGIVQASVDRWFGRHLRFVNPAAHLVLQNELQPGAAQLTDIFSRRCVGANDTPATVGYAPLTETERLVLAAEHSSTVSHSKVNSPRAARMSK